MHRHKKAPSAPTLEAHVAERQSIRKNVMSNNSTAVSNVIPFRFEAKEVRTLLIDDQPWFCAADVCVALSYANSRKAISDNCREKGVTSSYTLTSRGRQALTFISEGNLTA